MEARNQTFTETKSQGVFLLAEGFALLFNLSRLCVVAIVLATNIISLRHNSNVKCNCLRIYVQDSVKFASVIYIATWTPFLLYSFSNGQWILIDEYLFCRMQNYMTNAILLVLMSLGALLFYSKFRRIGYDSKLTSVLTLVAWILPQFIYFVILTAVETPSKRLDFEFIDQLICRKTPNQLGTSAILYKIGFTICGQNLDRMALTHYILQYIVIVIPIIIICALVFICQLSKTRFEIKEQSFFEQCHEELVHTSDGFCNCALGGAETNTLEVLLSLSVIWLTIIRPFLFFLWNPEHVFVDIGSHLVLTIISVFSPVLPIKHRKFKNVYQIEMFTPVSKQLISDSKPYPKLTDEN